MAQTRTITRRKRAAFRIIDAGTPIVSLLTRRPRRLGADEPPRTFLIVEPWGIGDVVLATPVMQAIRRNFPAARILLLSKEYGRTLLANSGLVDDVIVADLPWTAFTDKYRPNRYDIGALTGLLARLRSERIDVSLDARRDFRSNLITYLGGARRRIGFDFGGATRLLTDALPSGEQNEHKVTDWLQLLEPLLRTPSEPSAPRLVSTEEERLAARKTLRAHGIGMDKPIIAVHAGASQVVRRWHADRFASVVDTLAETSGAQLFMIRDPEGHADTVRTRNNIPRLQFSLREMMAVIAESSALLCSDSGPMHIAGALGTPVTALFGPQVRAWYGPRGQSDRVVSVTEMPCRPCFDACIYGSAICMEGITAAAVVDAVTSQIAEISLAV
ncbi:MAG: glycosyltransferase family 9 protein [Gemmatimonadaceae bacterium]|nr:glycosyltransferase family 9 protein [Gemmatimonadaceae bacterium]